MEWMELIYALLISVGIAVFYGLMAYARSYMSDPESFQPKRLIRTMVQAVIIGGLLWYMGLPVSSETMIVGEQFIATSGFLVIVIDIIVVTILRWSGMFEQD